MKRLVWFRNDLRIHDNAALSAAVGTGEHAVTCLFVFDGAGDRNTRDGYPRIGSFRKRFIAESVVALRENLRRLGGDLHCAIGDPAAVIGEVCARSGIEEVYFSTLTPFDERRQERAVEAAARRAGAKCFSFHTHALLDPGDHKVDALTTPMGFSKLKKIAETAWAVRAPLPAITKLGEKTPPPKIEAWTPETFLTPRDSDDRGVHPVGGEAAALARAKHFARDADRLHGYKDTRNGLLELDDSSKCSAALALGCLSVRHLYAEVRAFERERGANGSTLWFLYELLWRDFFFFAAAWRGSGLFTSTWEPPSGPKPIEKQDQSFRYWCEARTGKPFIDAAMTELRTTGWMSNRMRQNVASHLVHTLGVDWRRGAAWFESLLVDYDAASNWGNWAYVVGAGPRNQPHVFDVDQQAEFYDPDGEYAEFWLS